MKTYVDANYFISLNNPNDINYQKASSLKTKFLDHQTTFLFSNFTFLEIVTVLSQRTSRSNAVIVGHKLLYDKQIQFTHITDELQQKSWQIFQEINKKNLSFVDCSILAVMRYEDIDMLLTFDQKDFSPLQKKYGFHLFPLK